MKNETALFCPSLPTKDTTYNGWTNYATWRINLEMFDAFNPNAEYENKPETSELADYMKEFAEELLESEADCNGNAPSLVFAYAMAFLSDVNWYEIAENKLADWQDYSDVEGLR